MKIFLFGISESAPLVQLLKILDYECYMTALYLSETRNVDKLKNIAIVSGALSAKVKASNTEDVLGVALESDVYMVITMSRDNITAIDLTYDSENGKVSVSVSYIYLEEVTPELPEEPEEGGETPVEPEEGGETPIEPEEGGETPVEPEEETDAPEDVA